MIKKTLCFSNPAFLSLKDGQLVIKMPEMEKAKNVPEMLKKEAEITTWRPHRRTWARLFLRVQRY